MKSVLRPERLVLYTPNFDPAPAQAQIFQFNLKRLGVDVEIKFFPAAAFFEKVATRGEPFDVALWPSASDYTDPDAYFAPLNGKTIRTTGNVNVAYFDRPRYNRAIARNNRRGTAARLRAFANLDVDMMRNDPPYASFMDETRRDFVSRSFGCYLFQPAEYLDVGATCKK